MFDPHRTAKQIREARMVIVGELYKRGFSFREIREEVIKRGDQDTYSLSTVKKDVDILLKEWRKTRIADVDQAIQLELESINTQIRECWYAWDRSKTDHKVKSKKQSGIAAKGSKSVAPDGSIADGDTKIQTTAIEQTEKDQMVFGDPRYQDLINKLGMERRKLLGLYAVDKSELTLKGSISPDKWLEENSEDE
ncbi:hypothetical protein AY601_4093 [Pedobacter cryoconitis]|uniref:Uncharacterized protein n=1 Tax=Pedobacter cryoconitis TaxID=188932 RepID=A0A127VHY7_9SPHI|nr:hypothetical protein [Pedobacter cryoconitis]AMQ00944.1 hypothetical protein AY601_4093 [Pedobacter cryoconitis]